MDFPLSEEHTLMRQSLRKFAEAEYPFTTRQRASASPEGFDRDFWRGLAELGVLGLPFGEDLGGSGGSALDVYIAFEALGRVLAAEPALSTLVLGGQLLERGGTAQQRRQLIPGIVDGERILGVGLAEAQSRFNLANVETRATPAAGGWTLRGAKNVVYNAALCDTLLVSARTGGEPRDADGITLFAVDAGSEGIARRDYPTVDGFRASEIELNGVSADAGAVVGEVGAGWPLVERAVDEATLAVCAEAVGIMEVLVERTLDHCRTQHAFGQPIGRFQAVQHRLVDMRVAYEHAAAITLRAVRAMELPQVERSAAVSAAKVQVGKEADFVGPNAIQLHGAIGLSDELDVGHLFRRLVVIGSLFGDIDHHLGRFMEGSEWLRPPDAEEAG